MRNRFIISAICVGLLLGLCACGDKNEKNPVVAETGEEYIPQTELETEGSSSDTDSPNKILVGTYKVPLQKIYVDVPAFNLIEEGYTRIFWDSGIKYVTFTCLYEETADSVMTAHKKAIEKFMLNVADHHHVKEIGKLDDKTVTINGIETYCYEGKISCGTGNMYDAYIYGYSFVVNGFPCSVIGVVKDESQPEAEKKLVKELVDEMMKTVRYEN